MQLHTRALSIPQLWAASAILAIAMVVLVTYLLRHIDRAERERTMHRITLHRADLEREKLALQKRLDEALKNQPRPAPTFGPGDYPLRRERAPIYPAQQRSP